MQPSKQHAAPCVKRVEWGLGTRGLGMVAAFWAIITVFSAWIVEVTQEAGVAVDLLPSVHPFSHLIRESGPILPPPFSDRVI